MKVVVLIVAQSPAISKLYLSLFLKTRCCGNSLLSFLQMPQLWGHPWKMASKSQDGESLSHFGKDAPNAATTHAIGPLPWKQHA